MASLKYMIVGAWTLTIVNAVAIPEDGETVDVKFNADGRVEGEVKKWGVKSKDEKENLILGESEFEFKSCDGKKLIFIDRADEITFSKKNSQSSLPAAFFKLKTISMKKNI